MKVHCQECGAINNVNPGKATRDKLCTKCRSVISKAGRRPNPKWEEEKAKNAAERERVKPRGGARGSIPLTFPEQMLLRAQMPRITIKPEEEG